MCYSFGFKRIMVVLKCRTGFCNTLREKNINENQLKDKMFSLRQENTFYMVMPDNITPYPERNSSLSNFKLQL